MRSKTSKVQNLRRWNIRQLVEIKRFVLFGQALFRLQREKKVNDKAIQGVIEAFELGPWQKLNLQPEWHQMKLLASQWSLRGADLWHLATAAMIRMDLPELVLLTFDKRLLLAAKGEKLF